MPRRSASIRKALAPQTDLKHHAEHCSVDPQSLVAIDREVRHQVRIERGFTYAVAFHGVDERHPSASPVSRLFIHVRRG